MESKLKEYIKNWKSIDGIKPCNEREFIDMFCDFMDKLDDSRDIDFNGEGSYFGNQVTVQPDSSYSNDGYRYGFEIAYSKNKISVYRSDNEGFWVPEYVCMKIGDPGFIAIHGCVNKNLKRLFGLV